MTNPTGDALAAAGVEEQPELKKMDIQTPKIGSGLAGPGRPKGLPNKTTALLKDAILKAATAAGGGDMVAYLTKQANDNPGPFMALLGKVLPMQITGEDGGPVQITRIELVALKPNDRSTD